MINKRDHFRIEYPEKERPRILIAGKHYAVVNLSEAGIKFIVSEAFPYSAGSSINAKLSFSNGKTCDVAGKVVRTEGETELVLQLSERVPLPMIMEEQRLLLQKYKK